MIVPLRLGGDGGQVRPTMPRLTPPLKPGLSRGYERDNVENGLSRAISATPLSEFQCFRVERSPPGPIIPVLVSLRKRLSETRRPPAALLHLDDIMEICIN